MKNDFGFITLMSMRGNVRIVLVVIVLIIILILLISSLSIPERFQFWTSNLRPIGDFKGKVLYVESIKESIEFPPYGDIMLGDIHSKSSRRINFDQYYDASPSYSPINNVIYFESKRKEGSQSQLLSAPSDLYKYDIESNKILHARTDIAFALKYDDSEIVSPLVSMVNDSLFAFFERRYSDQRLVVCNFIKKVVLVDIPVEVHKATIIDSFMKSYVVVFDSERSNRMKVGTYFVNLETQGVAYVPDEFASEYYFTGLPRHDSDYYYGVGKGHSQKAKIYSYNVEAQNISFVNDLAIGTNSSVEVVVNDSLVVLYRSDDRESIVLRTNQSENEIISTGHEITGFRFYF